MPNFNANQITRIVTLVIILSFINLTLAGNTAQNQPNTKRTIVNNDNLYSERNSIDQTVMDKNNQKTIIKSGIIGQVVKGEIIKEIHRIRYSRMQITLLDGRKGWVDIQTVSPSPEKDAYLMHKIKLSEIMAQPKNGNYAALISDSNKNTILKRGTPLKVLEWKYEIEKNQTKLFKSGTWWAKVEIEGYTGWVEKSKFRFNEQMFDTAIPAIWYPIKWISDLLGDGFFAGLFILFLMVIPISFGYFIARAISTKLKWLPNFTLYIIIVIIAIPIYLHTFMTVYDASTFNRADILMMNLFGALVFITAISSFIFVRRNIYYRRCPDCRLWEGKHYESEKLSESTFTSDTTWVYSDGSIKREVNSTTFQEWKDFCNCQNCGYCWVIRRSEKIEN